ncbi:KpsF/GutQ family sugar-phosphate isomerase [Candidatus Poribacteria bacterium]|nr:KpsF/GutQ family sugar-phosphate isomerase [Candidatus Poribacteria bacterium]
MGLQIGKQVIQTEIQALNLLLEGLGDSFESAVETLKSCKGKIVVTGVGKSGIIGQKIAATLSGTGSPAVFMHASEAVHGDLGLVTEEDVSIIISYSGETAEALNVVQPMKERGITIIAMTGRPESTLAGESDIHLDISVRREADPLNLAPTSSTTAMLVLGDALAITLSVEREFTRENFYRFHPGGNLGKELKSEVGGVK